MANFTSITSLLTENKCHQLESQLVNKSMVSFPDNDHLENYIVARPDEIKGLVNTVHVHAEKTLLNRFDSLKDEFSKSGTMVSTVIFYSWLMPCSGCTQLLVNKFKKRDYDVVVVYNNDWTKAITEEENKHNRKLLRETGIDVYQVRYQSNLRPI